MLHTQYIRIKLFFERLICVFIDQIDAHDLKKKNLFGGQRMTIEGVCLCGRALRQVYFGWILPYLGFIGPILNVAKKSFNSSTFPYFMIYDEGE